MHVDPKAYPHRVGIFPYSVLSPPYIGIVDTALRLPLHITSQNRTFLSHSKNRAAKQLS